MELIKFVNYIYYLTKDLLAVFVCYVKIDAGQ